MRPARGERHHGAVHESKLSFYRMHCEFHGPWFNNFDAAISKRFSITERLKLQFRADAVNVLNHPNFDCIDTNINSGTFGRALCVAGDRGDAPGNSGIYGPSAGGSWSNGVARRFQFSAKLFF